MRKLSLLLLIFALLFSATTVFGQAPTDTPTPTNTAVNTIRRHRPIPRLTPIHPHRLIRRSIPTRQP